MPTTPLLFILDRDGVINVDVGKPGVIKIGQFELIPGSAAAVRQINDSGARVAVVTNQRSVTQGLLQLDGLEEIHGKMQKLLWDEAGAKIDVIHAATTEPGDFKPRPTLVQRALLEAGVQPSEAVMIGDNWTDLQAATRADVRPLLVSSSHHGEAAKERLQAGELPEDGQVPVVVHVDLSTAVQAELRPGPSPAP